MYLYITFYKDRFKIRYNNNYNADEKKTHGNLKKNLYSVENYLEQSRARHKCHIEISLIKSQTMNVQ